MAVKYTQLGLLIYITMAVYLLAFLTSVIGKKKIGSLFYTAGFILAIIAFIYRWISVQHVPFQNMFEVFLSMAISIYPITLFCCRILSVGGQAIDMLIGAILLFPAGFVFHSDPQMLPPALQSWLFTPHVAVYLISYVIMAKAAVQAFCQLKGGDSALNYEDAAYKMVCLGFPLLTLGLILGSYWGKLAWGDYWGWDPKELWSLVSWLIYVAYLHFRYMFGKRFARINSIFVLLGLAAIIITLLWVNLSKIFPGLHSYAS